MVLRRRAEEPRERHLECAGTLEALARVRIDGALHDAHECIGKARTHVAGMRTREPPVPVLDIRARLSFDRTSVRPGMEQARDETVRIDAYRRQPGGKGY